jgi:hypothetical protein
MAEQENIQLIKEAYAAFSRGDIPALLNTLTEDVDWFTPGPPDILPYAGSRRGREGVAQFFAQLAEAEETELFEIQEFIAQGDKVAATGKYRGRIKASGQSYEGELAHIFTLKGGKIARFHEYIDTTAAVELYRALPAKKAQAT